MARPRRESHHSDGITEPTSLQQASATWGNSGIEPDEGKGISSPGRYEVDLMGPPNNGERQWRIMWGWTYR